MYIFAIKIFEPFDASRVRTFTLTFVLKYALRFLGIRIDSIETFSVLTVFAADSVTRSFFKISGRKTPENENFFQQSLRLPFFPAAERIVYNLRNELFFIPD